jgi:hypothetical protein
MKSRLNLSFGIPEHGWLPVEIFIGISKHCFEASDAYVDSLSLLGESLLAAARGRPSVAYWCLEPGEVRFVFSVRGDTVRFRVEGLFEESFGRRSFRGSKAKVLLPLWYGLRELLDRIRTLPETAWTWEFSTHVLDDLQQEMGRLEESQQAASSGLWHAFRRSR